MKPLIVLKDITKVYCTSKVKKMPLAGLSMSVGDGEFAAVTGRSGCGKTTLLNILGCLDRADSGSYYFGDTEATALTNSERARFRRANVGFIFQGCNLIDRLTARQNVELALKYKGVPAYKRALFASAALEQVGMLECANSFPCCMSGGQQQRVAAARAFAPSPRLILADEPAGNLDPENARALTELLIVMKSAGTTIVMITHSPVQAAMADRVIEL